MTLVAGLVSGAGITTATRFGLDAPEHVVPVATIYVVATCVLTWVRPRFVAGAVTWLVAFGGLVAWWSPDGSPDQWDALLLVAAYAGTLLVAPWWLATAALWHLLAGPTATREHDLDELHS